MKRVEPTAERYDWPDGLKLPVEVLADWLRLRRSSDLGLKQLKLDRCRCLTPEYVRQLRECMGAEGDVEWDGLVARR